MRDLWRAFYKQIDLEGIEDQLYLNYAYRAYIVLDCASKINSIDDVEIGSGH